MRGSQAGLKLGILSITALLSLGVFAGQPGPAQPETIAQRLSKARTSRDPEIQVAAIRSLSGITDKEEIDNKVVDALLELMKANDIFVRLASIETLGKIQVNVTKDGKAKTAYRAPFLALLKNKEEHPKIRSAVADVFGATLEPKGRDELPDKDAFKAGILEVAKNKAEPNKALRKTCIIAVGRFGLAENIPVLADVLIESDDDIRAAGAEAIERLLAGGSEVQLPVPTVNKLVELIRDSKVATPLRISVMKVLAVLVRDGNTTAKNEAFPVIMDLADFDKSKDNDLVLAAVESLGIIGSAEAVVPLTKTYGIYFDAKAADNPKDVPVRKAVAKAMLSVLKVQNEARAADMRAVKGAADLLVKMLDEDASAEVKGSAVFSLQYLYPKKFEAEHKVATLALIDLMKNSKDEAMKKKVNETLEFITEVNYGIDHERWMEWFQKKYKLAPKAGGKEPAPAAPKEPK
ncbi:MAG TPA: HEAT repeat domain-containing protein [Planctomycetota bacterium]|nr:HEAT repeat domain-containing protein [Planctomycetota bacterium]